MEHIVNRLYPTWEELKEQEEFLQKEREIIGATHSKESGETVQEETIESEETLEDVQETLRQFNQPHLLEEEDTGMFSKEARKALGWEHGLPRFYELLMLMGSIHSKKNRDYTSIHPLENFFRVAMNVGISPEDVVEVMVATKSARIKSLRDQGVEPQNESLLDSYLDRAVYSLLGAAIHEMSGEEQARLCERIATEDLFVEKDE